jgi:hypothetical protein
MNGIAEVKTETPTPFMRGKFAIFETPDGGLHIAYRLEGSGDDKHITLPAAAIRMAEMMGDKLPFLNPANGLYLSGHEGPPDGSTGYYRP